MMIHGCRLLSLNTAGVRCVLTSENRHGVSAEGGKEEEDEV